ncbi:MarR family transcriptional regulator [Gluconacetobacter tumulisoli]|uniref:MarR family transcriptional regulator n=1 Tax=Gluconacetobacter tumulisoli TaxID=1286189 RepID=A0A7W4PMH0_9PROT|nr:MarR family transcriptional regulator [Gluconacetobacter tumulisoli]MBB2201639.1 MarR family transcriptional regulator [Gluconacetobacter tumulisoli]
MDATAVSCLRGDLTRLARRLRQEARNDPESWTRMLVISAIDRLGDEATPSALARAENMRSPNLAAILRDLEASALVTRTPDQVDRRRIRVRLTDEGREILRQNRRRRDEWLAEAMNACLTERERAQVFTLGPLLVRIAAYGGIALIVIILQNTPS